MVADREDKERGDREGLKSVNGKAVFAPATSDSLLCKEDKLALTIYLQGIGFFQNVWASILIKSFI